MTENEVEDKLTSFITVFKYIDDKDVFQKVSRTECLVSILLYFEAEVIMKITFTFSCSSMQECLQNV